MATNFAEQQLTQMIERLEAQAEHQESKGGDCICLTKDEYDELFMVMKNAADEIDGLINGSA